jgi:hypothetical protein
VAVVAEQVAVEAVQTILNSLEQQALLAKEIVEEMF